jgi:hypothetical protein
VRVLERHQSGLIGRGHHRRLSDKTVGSLRRGAGAEFPQSIAGSAPTSRATRGLRPSPSRRGRAARVQPEASLRQIAVRRISVGTARDVRTRVGGGRTRYRHVGARSSGGYRRPPTSDPPTRDRSAPAPDRSQRPAPRPFAAVHRLGRAAVRWLAAASVRRSAGPISLTPSRCTGRTPWPSWRTAAPRSGPTSRGVRAARLRSGGISGLHSLCSDDDGA